ncbi:MAG: LemA family protein [Nitrospirae bacterium]|nr:LemA family protein [Nitrospirota bacterium]
MVIWILSIIIGLLLIWTIYIYNTLIALKNEVKNAWKQVDVQLKRRHDLIPNLITVVKGYMEFERDVLEKVTAARTKAVLAVKIHEKAIAENILTQALSHLFAVIENYPVLKSNENVMELQEELTSTENKIAFSRQLYNDLVANFATKIEIFPNNIIASLFHFSKAEYFNAGEADKILPSFIPR